MDRQLPYGADHHHGGSEGEREHPFVSRPVGFIYGALFLLLIGTFTTGTAILRSAELAHARGEVARLAGENTELSGRVEEMQGTLSGLTVQLAELTSFEEKIRAVADLDPIDEDVRRVGVGGPAVSGRASIS